MVNTVLLERLIRESGLKRGFIAEKLDISLAWLSKKIAGLVPFKAYEIQILCELLNITDLEVKEAVFFAVNVEVSSTSN
jgi:hypothetical protein